MENFTALSITCKHLNIDCKDLTYSKLKKQKHATHSMCHRLRKKLAISALANKLLTLCWISTTHENRMLQKRISEYIEQARQMDGSENISL